jgi:hypothetical protein
MEADKKRAASKKDAPLLVSLETTLNRLRFTPDESHVSEVDRCRVLLPESFAGGLPHGLPLRWREANSREPLVALACTVIKSLSF